MLVANKIPAFIFYGLLQFPYPDVSIADWIAMIL